MPRPCRGRETGCALRASGTGTARPGSASTARQSEEPRFRQRHLLQPKRRMVCVEAGLDQSPQGEPVRWCPHRPLPPHGDVTTRRVASFLFTSAIACYRPSSSWRACHATTLQPRPLASKDRRDQLRPTRARWEAARRVCPPRIVGSPCNGKACMRAESLVSDLRVPRAEISGGDARRGHVIRRIIGQNFVAARIYVVCVRVCVLVERKRERGVICPPPFPFFSVPRNLVT